MKVASLYFTPDTLLNANAFKVVPSDLAFISILIKQTLHSRILPPLLSSHSPPLLRTPQTPSPVRALLALLEAELYIPMQSHASLAQEEMLRNTVLSLPIRNLVPLLRVHSASEVPFRVDGCGEFGR